MSHIADYIADLHALDILDDYSMIAALAHVGRVRHVKELWQSLTFGSNPVITGNRGRPIGDRYIYLGRLGAGGIAEVEHVYDRTQSGRSICVGFRALKHLKQKHAKDRRMLGRLRREIAVSQLVKKLNNPYLLRIEDYELDQDGNAPFAIFEYCNARPLSSIAFTGPIPVPNAIAIILRVCGAAFDLHTTDLIHRDIKPSNILWDGKTFVKLIDLGLVQVPSEFFLLSPNLSAFYAETPPAAKMGTYLFMAPEQRRGERATDATDVFAIARVLLFLLTASDATVPSRRDLPASLCSTELLSVISRATDPELKRRTPTVQDFVLQVLDTPEGSLVVLDDIGFPSPLRAAIDIRGLIIS